MNLDYNFDKNFRNDKYLYLYVRSFIGFNRTCLKERKKKFDIEQIYELEKMHTISDRMFSWDNSIRSIYFIPEIGSFVVFFNLNDSSIIKMTIQYLILLVSDIVNLFRKASAKEYDYTYEEELTC